VAQRSGRAFDGRLPPRLRPAWQVARSVVGDIGRDRLILVSAGVAFFLLLSVAPLLVAAVALYGLFTTQEDLARQFQEVSGALPADVQELLLRQLENVVEASPRGLSWGAVVAVVLALFVASTGMQYVVIGSGLAWGEKECRSFWRLRGLALLFALGAIALLGIAVVVGAVLPRLLPTEPAGVRVLVSIGSWVALAVVAALVISLVYRFGPDRPGRRWRPFSAGTLVATGLWLAGSAAYFSYVATIGNYEQVYGAALGGVVITMLWLLLTALAVLLGSEVDAEIADRHCHGDLARRRHRAAMRRTASGPAQRVAGRGLGRRGRVGGPAPAGGSGPAPAGGSGPAPAGGSGPAAGGSGPVRAGEDGAVAGGASGPVGGDDDVVPAAAGPPAAVPARARRLRGGR
jgi:membrane protein